MCVSNKWRWACPKAWQEAGAADATSMPRAFEDIEDTACICHDVSPRWALPLPSLNRPCG